MHSAIAAAGAGLPRAARHSWAAGLPGVAGAAGRSGASSRECRLDRQLLVQLFEQLPQVFSSNLVVI